MTRRRKLKRRVRTLMHERGVSYTAALRQLIVETGSDGARPSPATATATAKGPAGRARAGITERRRAVMREVKIETITLEWSDEQLGRYRDRKFPLDKLGMVLLREIDGERELQIFMQEPEASAIRRALEDTETPRPMTHDLYAETIRSLDATVAAVRVTHAEAGTIFAELELRSPTGDRVLSARPSDGIAVALRLQAPIFVADALLHPPRSE